MLESWAFHNVGLKNIWTVIIMDIWYLSILESYIPTVSTIVGTHVNSRVRDWRDTNVVERVQSLW